MRNRRLIDLQTELLRRLTSEALMFGTGDPDLAALDPELRGIDFGRLRLEAEFSFDKRSGRLRETFARTASIFGFRFSGILKEFAAACPPRSYERFWDARDFFRWLQENRADDLSIPEWTVDVAKIEITLAHARTLRPVEAEQDALAACPFDPPALRYRTHPCVALVRCKFDVGPLFRPEGSGKEIVRRDVPLAILSSRNRRRPQVMEIVPEAFDVLERSAEWSRLAPKMAGGASFGELVIGLSARGLMLTCGASPDEGRG